MTKKPKGIEMFGSRGQVKTWQQIRDMERAGHIVAGMLGAVRAEIRAGVTTAELDAVAEDFLNQAGGLSNFKGYYGYPAVICASVNEEIVHGIPGGRVLEPGDIISIDGGCSVRGADGRRWHGDSAISAIVPPVPEDSEALSSVTETALWTAIAALADARYLNAVGDAVESVVEAHPETPLDIVRDYVGHGIGTAMHEAPEVLNYRVRERGVRLKPGMVFAVEPMLTLGSAASHVLDDEWTVVTNDRSRACQWEHTVAILPDGVRVLTALDAGAAGLARFGLTPAEIPAT